MTSRTPRRLLTLLFALLLGVATLTACGGDKPAAKEEAPAKVLQTAKEKLDTASSWRMDLKTESVPKGGGNAVLAATGVGTHEPAAWEGDVKVVLGGINATVPIVAVDGKVHAKLPLTSSFAVINPAEYDAPNPVDFMDPDAGLSALLASMENPKKKGEARAGSKVVTIYEGTIPGATVKKIIPSASTDASYATTVNIDDKGQVSTVSVTGPFFKDTGDVTYDLAFSDFDKDVTITAP